MFYHVRITQKSNKSHDETKADLTEEQLLERFLLPYEQGDPIIINGKTIPMEDLERIRISRSDKETKYIIQQIEAEDRNSPAVFIGGPSYEWRAADRAEDITDTYISGPPGYKRGSTKAEKTERNSSMDGHASSSRVFVVHGHDHALKSDLEVFLRNIGLEPIVLHRQPDEGLTVIEKFERYADVGFAIILLTPDDVSFSIDQAQLPEDQRAIEYRARQNVIFEFGYFVGKIGRGRVCCIYREGVSLPSDLAGLLYKKVTSSIEEIGYSLIKELQQAGLRPRL
jgi:predicted nucleotide-binding protein